MVYLSNFQIPSDHLLIISFIHLRPLFNYFSTLNEPPHQSVVLTRVLYSVGDPE